MATPHLDTLQVLVVDDDPTTALLLADVLERDGLGVSVAGTAEEALALLRGGARPDLLLSDVILPGADGIELCRRVRQGHVDANVPVLLISSAAERATRLRALEEGADDLLSKPIDPIELRARVRSLSRLSQARAQLASRERIDAVLAEMSDAVVLTDGAGAMRDANARAHALLRLPDEPGTSVLDHLVGEHEVVESSGAPGHGVQQLTLHRPRRDLEPALWLQVRVLTLPDDPGGGHAIVVRDVTDEHAAQALADVVLSSVAHKVRTPMTGIRSVADTLDRIVDEGPAKQLVGVLRRSARRLDTSLGRIIEHAAAVSRGEDDVKVLLRPGGSAAVLRHLVSPSTVATVDAIDDLVDRPVLVALGPLAAALDEYVDNARAAGDEWPSARISLDGDDVVVEVTDRGDGFAPEEADRIFHPFHQEDRTGQDPRMGLGLPLVRHLALRAGGGVCAVPGQDGGATFTVTVPVAAPSGPDRTADGHDGASAGTLGPVAALAVA